MVAEDQVVATAAKALVVVDRAMDIHMDIKILEMLLLTLVQVAEDQTIEQDLVAAVLEYA